MCKWPLISYSNMPIISAVLGHDKPSKGYLKEENECALSVSYYMLGGQESELL